MFSAWVVSHWPDARITAFEPDPANVELYRRWMDAASADVDLVEAAATSAAGRANFQSDLGGGSFITADDSGSTTVECVDSFDYLPEADFVKIDIEGGEWAILADPRLADLSNVVFVIEYHRHMAPFWPPYDAAVECFTKAGFETGFNKPNYWGHGILWAWKD